MLKLYSFGPGANSLKPMLTLYEKGLDYEQVQLNPAKFEHHSEWYKAINPRGQVPALWDDGRIVTESTVICEYLEDAYPTEVKLRPDDPFGRAEMRVWTKWVDENFCWCVSTIGWHRYVGKMAQNLSDEEFEEKVASIPVYEQQVKWRRAREGFPIDTYRRVMAHANFTMHVGRAWTGARIEGGRVRIETERGPFAADFVICGTGIRQDLTKRRELAAFADKIALWGDRYTPPPGEEDAALAAFPYLGPDYAFLEKRPADWTEK